MHGIAEHRLFDEFSFSRFKVCFAAGAGKRATM
jgi:hypothetical protein